MSQDLPDYSSTVNPPYNITTLAGKTVQQTQTLDLKPGTLALGVSVDTTIQLTQLSVSGVQSGISYGLGFTLGDFGALPMQWCSVSPKDTQVEVKWTAGADAGNLIIDGAFVPVSVAIDAGTQVQAAICDSAGENFDGFTVPSLDGSGNKFGQVVYQTSPAPWQAPLQKAHINGTISSDSTLAVITGAGTLTIWLHHVHLEFENLQTVASELVVQSDEAAPDKAISLSTQLAGPHDCPFGGVTVGGAGAGLELANNSGGTLTVRGYVTYQQA